MKCKMVLRSIAHEMGSVVEVNDDGSTSTKAGKVATVVFHPVYHGGDLKHENAKFWAATPGGELRLNIVNARAVEGLEVGQEYYVDVTPAK